MGNAEGGKRGLHHAQRAQHHRRIHVAHVGDTEGFARQSADADAEDDTALDRKSVV